MKVKQKAKRVVSGLLTAVTLFIYGVITNQQLCCGASERKKNASFGRGTKPAR